MIDIVVMAHPSREAAALDLAEKLDAFILWDEKDDEWDTGSRAWRCINPHRNLWGVVIQDDAIVGADFRTQAERILFDAPRTAVSFYVGTGRPRARSVTTAVARAEQVDASWLECDGLLWGVAIALPVGDIDPMLTWAKGSTLPYDQCISAWYRTQHRTVRHCWPSLVDHDDTLPGLVHHGKPRVPRHAHRVERWEPGGPTVTI